MSRVQFWVLVCSLIAFFAGGAVGLLIGEASAAPAPLSTVFEDYENRFQSVFALPDEERKILREILISYEDDVTKVKNRFALLPEPQEELRRAGNRAEKRVRDLLTEEQRTRYEQLIKSGEGLSFLGDRSR